MSKNELSKEEYIQAITRLYENSYVDLKDCDLFSNLITEHFDSPPLKFEELKVGMWVWDNEKNKYNKIVSLEKDKNIEFYYIANDRTKFKVKYKENRFYRKQME